MMIEVLFGVVLAVLLSFCYPISLLIAGPGFWSCYLSQDRELSILVLILGVFDL